MFPAGFPLAPESPPPLLCTRTSTLPPLWPNQQLQVRLVPGYEYKPLNTSSDKSRLVILWAPGSVCRGNMLRLQGAPDSLSFTRCGHDKSLKFLNLCCVGVALSDQQGPTRGLE